MGARPPDLHAPNGIRDALRGISRTLYESLRVRFALFAMELAEELQQRKQRWIIAALAAAFLHVAILLLTVLVAALFWDTHRIAALGAMAGFYFACGVAALIRYRVLIAAKATPFAATRGELEQDFAGLRWPE